MQSDIYKTIAKPSEGIYKEKGSKFLAFAYPVFSEEEIKTILDNLRKKYHDAKHHCYAYRLGLEKEIFRMNDDGEPSHTAGSPIFGQIQSKDLTNILIVVVRYFGGTLLGTGGLINAYKTSEAHALENAEIINKADHVIFKIIFDYNKMIYVMKIIKDEKIDIIEKNFSDICTMTISVKKSMANDISEKFKNFILHQLSN
jgi:uncharacterized YigZ family protein